MAPQTAADVQPAELPPRYSEAGLIAEAVMRLLGAGIEVVCEDRSYTLREEARGRQRTWLRGLGEVEAFDVRTTVRQGPDGRWRVYAMRSTSR
jgi:hypothetical protein